MRKLITVTMELEVDEKNMINGYDYNRGISDDIKTELSCCWNYFENINVTVKDIDA